MTNVASEINNLKILKWGDNSKYKVQCTKYKVQSTKCKVQSAKCKVQSTKSICFPLKREHYCRKTFTQHIIVIPEEDLWSIPEWSTNPVF